MQQEVLFRRKPDLEEAVLQGLSKPQKELPSRLFYDEKGSDLFERITELEEYYPTRTERSILEAHADSIAEALLAVADGLEVTLIEFGSGSSFKTKLIIESLQRRQKKLDYVPIDISGEFLRATAKKLMDQYVGLNVRSLEAEYFEAIELLNPTEGPRLILFLGSNIGNFEQEESERFLKMLAQVMKPTDRLLLGMDLQKDVDVLFAAYNDSKGVTAAFNMNVLSRINEELGGHFDLAQFEHSAAYVHEIGRIEMHLVSKIDQDVCVDSLSRSFHFAAGESIHTENSHKYKLPTFERQVPNYGLCIDQVWTDPQKWFALVMMERCQ